MPPREEDRDSQGRFTQTPAELSSGTLKWSVQVSHAIVAFLHVRLVVSLGVLKASSSTPKCSIEVWAEDHSADGELAYCRSLVSCRKGRCARVLWLGRSSSRPVHERVRGLRCVRAGGLGAELRGKGGADYKQRTVAEAVLGVAMAIVELFGVETVELEAMDNGSGRLVQLYLDIGFAKCQVPGDIIWMEAPVHVIAGLAPPAWLEELVPTEFDPTTWLRTQVTQLWFERARFGKLPQLKWTVTFPHQAVLEVRLAWCTDSNDNLYRLRAEVLLLSVQGSELARARGAVWVEEQRLIVSWLGRKFNQPIHVAVRGQPAYYTDCSSASEVEVHGDCSSSRCGKVTAGVALLGFLAELGTWFGVSTTELHAPDDGSGKLVSYLSSLGFSECAGDVGVADAAGLRCHPPMKMPCDVLAKRCCPVEWRARLMDWEDAATFSAIWALPKVFEAEDDVKRPSAAPSLSCSSGSRPSEATTIPVDKAINKTRSVSPTKSPARAKLEHSKKRRVRSKELSSPRAPPKAAGVAPDMPPTHAFAAVSTIPRSKLQLAPLPSAGATMKHSQAVVPLQDNTRVEAMRSSSEPVLRPQSAPRTARDTPSLGNGLRDYGGHPLAPLRELIHRRRMTHAW